VGFFLRKIFTDGVWWFYLFWLPDYLKKQFGMTKHDIMLPTFIVYGVAIIGSVYGGSIPMTLMKRGMPVYQARMTAMFIIALFPLTRFEHAVFCERQPFRSLWLDAGRRHHLHRRRCASGVVGKSVHHRFRHVSEKNRRLRHRHRRDGRRPRRRVILKLSPAGLTDTSSKSPTAYLIMFVICAVELSDCMELDESLLVPRHKPITDL
jgi:hypothetical protein